MKQKSYVMVKPGFANSNLTIMLIKDRLKKAGLLVEEEKYIQYDESHAKKHYFEHVEKPFYPDLEKYITSDKAYGMVVSGYNAIAKIRELCGATKNPATGTIRHDIPELLGLPIRVTENVVHSSDSPEAAEREIAIFEDLKTLSTNLKTSTDEAAK